MNKKINPNDITAYTLSEKIKKHELFGLIKALDARNNTPKSIKSFNKEQQPKKTAYIARQSQITRNLLRRYFVMRIAQIY